MSLFHGHGDDALDVRRQSFLESIGRVAARRLRLALQAALERARYAEDNLRIVRLLEEWRTSYDALHGDATFEVPEDLYVAAWQSYKEAIAHGDYYFSVDELLVFARLAHVDLVITTYQNGVFKVAGSTFREESPSSLVYVSLNDNGATRMRGHFERIWPCSRLIDYRNAWTVDWRVPCRAETS